MGRQMRQGEILFIEVRRAPKGLIRAEAIGGRLIIGHSETGHHHVIDVSRSPAAEHLIDDTNRFISYLRVHGDCEVEHLRDQDTHKPIPLQRGKIYEVRLRREYTPERLKIVSD